MELSKQNEKFPKSTIKLFPIFRTLVVLVNDTSLAIYKRYILDSR